MDDVTVPYTNLAIMYACPVLMSVTTPRFILKHAEYQDLLVNAVDDLGRTPLFDCLDASDQSRECCALLLGAGTDATQLTNGG